MSESSFRVTAPFDAIWVANTFLDLARKEDRSIDPMKMQKLVYFAHGWHLAIEDEPLICETVQAWRFGPVIESLYHNLKHFGSGPIQGFCRDWDEDISAQPKAIRDDSPTYFLLKQIWETYGKIQSMTLSIMSHATGSPWDQTREKYGDPLPRAAYIDNDIIKQYFLSLAKAQ